MSEPIIAHPFTGTGHTPSPHLPPPQTQYEVSGTTRTSATPFTNLRTAFQFAQDHFPPGPGAVTITARRMGSG